LSGTSMNLAERLDLLLGLGPHVGRLDHGAQALGGGDRLQARHATPITTTRAALIVPPPS